MPAPTTTTLPLADAFATSVAALCPESQAPCTVAGESTDVASPAKNSRPATGSASIDLSAGDAPGGRYEYEPSANGSPAHRHMRYAVGSPTRPPLRPISPGGSLDPPVPWTSGSSEPFAQPAA